MTIEKGAAWGRRVARPDDLLVVAGDRELVAAISAPDPRPVAVHAGDLHRTLGAPDPSGRSELAELPIDLLEVTLDDREPRRAVAHVLARSPWWRGSWWRGPVLAVMNAEFVGPYDVAPRGHPNDGRAESQLVDGGMRLRDRVTARARLRHGGHLPHPAIRTRSVREATWTFDRPMTVLVDGAAAGRSRSLAVRVLADAATVYA